MSKIYGYKFNHFPHNKGYVYSPPQNIPDMPNLEDFRHNSLANAYFILPNSTGTRIYRNYDKYATKAFYDTFRDISDLENARMFMLHSGSQTLSAISFWFLALESLIATHIKICCVKFELDFDIYKNQSLTQRLLSIIDLLEIDKKSFDNLGIIGKVHEFSQFRNEIFHERNIGNEVDFKKTAFCVLPFLSNQVDTFQAILIVTELAQRLRYVFPGTDTMPVLTLSSGENVIEEKLDKCYEHILYPAFAAALDKQDITTKLNIAPLHPMNARTSKFKRGEVLNRSVENDPAKQMMELNTERTTYSLSIFNNYISNAGKSIESEPASR